MKGGIYSGKRPNQGSKSSVSTWKRQRPSTKGPAVAKSGQEKK
jgi:hypothetical protein